MIIEMKGNIRGGGGGGGGGKCKNPQVTMD